MQRKETMRAACDCFKALDGADITYAYISNWTFFFFLEEQGQVMAVEEERGKKWHPLNFKTLHTYFSNFKPVLAGNNNSKLNTDTEKEDGSFLQIWKREMCILSVITWNAII